VAWIFVKKASMTSRQLRSDLIKGELITNLFKELKICTPLVLLLTAFMTSN
jgi:hypothetical protein